MDRINKIKLKVVKETKEIPFGTHSYVDDHGYINVGSTIDHNLRIGLIDLNGKQVIPCEYRAITPIENNLFIVDKNKKIGVINAKNEIVIPLEYEYIDYEGNGLLRAGKNNCAGIINMSGEVIIPFKYSCIFSFGNGMFACKKDGLYQIIDNNGNIISSPKDEEIKREYTNYSCVNENGEWGLLNDFGEKILPCKYKEIICVNNGHAIVRLRNGNTALIDIKTNLIIFVNPGCELRRIENNGLIPGKIGDKNGAIDLEGNVVIPFIYNQSLKFHGFQTTLTKMGNKRGAIDTKGNIVIPFKSRSLYRNYNNNEADLEYYMSEQKNTKIFYDNQGQEMFRSSMVSFSAFYEDMAVVQDKYGKTGYVNKAGEEVIPCQYRSGERFFNGLAIVTDEKDGVCLIDKTGKRINRYRYEEIKSVGDGYYVVTDSYEENVGVINRSGKVIIPNMYDLILYVGKNRFIGNINTNYYLINEEGNILPIASEKTIYVDEVPDLSDAVSASIEGYYSCISSEFGDIVVEEKDYPTFVSEVKAIEEKIAEEERNIKHNAEAEFEEIIAETMKGIRLN